MEKTMEKIVALAKGRGFVYPGSEIYGGLANTWDYGNLGVELKNNVKKAWWQKFVMENPYNVGVDCAILMNPQTWVASGHLGGFSDPLMDCRECHERFRADKLIEDYCEENGIELVDVTAPDPTGDSGVPGAQQFIMEDVPRQVEKYGPDTVFFTTNCSMQEPLIRQVFEQKAIYTLQCCPSPFHAFPAALNIDMKGHEADVQYMLEQLQIKVDEAGMTGRVSTWGVPCNMLFISAGVEYAKKVLEGETNGEILDDAILRETVQECANEFSEGMEMTLVNHVENGTEVKNHYLVMADFVTF